MVKDEIVHYYCQPPKFSMFCAVGVVRAAAARYGLGILRVETLMPVSKEQEGNIRQGSGGWGNSSRTCRF
jgi:hypothetical protein